MYNISPPNLNDPKFQRALIEEAQSRPWHALKNRGKAEQAYAAQDAQNKLGAMKLGLQSQIAKNANKWNTRNLKLREDELKDRKAMFWPYMGLKSFSTFYNLYENRLTEQKQRETAAMNKKLIESQIAHEERMAQYYGV